jgi:hypothetical protein
LKENELRNYDRKEPFITAEEELAKELQQKRAVFIMSIL